MNFFQKYFSFEETFLLDKAKQQKLLNFLVQGLMLLILGLLLLGLNAQLFFSATLEKQFLRSLLLSYVFLNTVAILVRKNFFTLSSILLFSFFLIIFLVMNQYFGFGFYLNTIFLTLVLLLSIIMLNFRLTILIGAALISILLFCSLLQNQDYLIVQQETRIFCSKLFIFFVTFLYCFIIVIFWIFLKDHYKRHIKMLKIQNLNRMLNLSVLLNLGKIALSINQQIRNQLTVISLVLQNAELKEQKIDNLDDAQVAVDQIDRFSRLAFYDYFKKAEYEIFDLNCEIKNLLILFKNKLQTEGVKIFLQSSHSFQLHADRVKLGLVLGNIVLNAIEAYRNVQREEKHVFIKLIKKPRNLLIKIKDYGPGISRQDLTEIFNPYFTSKNTAQALGLGLYLSQLLMQQAYASKIKVESVLNQGSIFTLYIKNKFLLI